MTMSTPPGPARRARRRKFRRLLYDRARKRAKRSIHWSQRNVDEGYYHPKGFFWRLELDYIDDFLEIMNQ